MSSRLELDQRLVNQAPNPSIERTSSSWLRQPEAAAHVER
jgi:hypothetical protein